LPVTGVFFREDGRPETEEDCLLSIVIKIGIYKMGDYS